MKNISHKRVIDHSTNLVVDEINKRARRQSRGYTILFALLGILILAYLVYSYSLARYDGFLVSRNAAIRHVSNIVVVDYNIKPGDVVCEGDTLYSYINIDYVQKMSDPFTISEIDSRRLDAEYRRDQLRSEYTEQKRTLDSLQIILKKAQKDVDLGVATKEFVEQLQWEKIQMYEKLEHTGRMITQEQKIVNTADANYDATQKIEGVGNYSHIYRKENTEVFGSAFNYRIAYVDMVIVDIDARHGILVMDGEPVITYMPYNTPDMLDLHVKMLLTPDEFSDIENGMEFEAFIGDDKIGDVIATYSSTYIKNSNSKKQVGEEYEYSHDNKEIIVRAEFVDKEAVTSKYRVDGFPVVLKRYRW